MSQFAKPLLTKGQNESWLAFSTRRSLHGQSFNTKTDPTPQVLPSHWGGRNAGFRTILLSRVSRHTNLPSTNPRTR